MNASHLEQALEHVVDTIMMYGEYPKPRTLRPRPPRQFDLWDWLVDNVNVDERNEFIFSATVDYRHHSSVIMDWQKKIEARLKESLVDSEIVRSKAEEYAEEE